MKYYIIALYGIILGMFAPANAQDKVFIPDYNFRFFLNSRYPTFMDVSGDSLILDSAATLIDTLDVSLLHVSNLTGVQYFTHINALFCVENYLITLPDLSPIENLKILNCDDNSLSSLPDFSANHELTILICSNNALTSLPDLSVNSELTILKCGTNWLNSLPNLSANIKLTTLDFSDNELISFPNLSANIKLTTLDFSDNELISFPSLPNNNILTSIKCNNNQLSDLPDVSASITLSEFRCENNKLDFSDTKELREIDNLSSILSFTYSPQKPFGTRDTINLNVGETLILSIEEQDSATGFQWYKNGTPIHDAVGTTLEIQNISIYDAGNYTCKSFGTALESPPMIHFPGISEFESEPFHINILNGTVIIDQENIDFEIYPNPNHGTFQIDAGNKPVQYTGIRIYNGLGQLVYTEGLKQESELITQKFDLRGFSTGLYYFLLLTDKEIIAKQILIDN